MSANPHAAPLVTAIDELLSGMHIYRKLPRPSTIDFHELVEERHRKVTHLALAAVFDPPPGLAGAGFSVWNPFNTAAWPPNPPPGWRSPNSNAGEAIERALRALQTRARTAASVPSTPAVQSRAGVREARDSTSPEERCLSALLAHRADNWSAQQFADHLGISRATFYRWLQESETLAAAWESIKREPRRGRIDRDRSEDGSGRRTSTVDAADEDE
jgi:hypothetical protein